MQLIIAGRPGFLMSDKYLKRAGMDYWEYAHIRQEPDLDSFLNSLDMGHTYLLTTKTQTPYTKILPQPGDNFLFGREDAGLSESLLKANPAACYTIPMRNPQARSLNLATSVGIVMYHALSLFDFGF